MTKKQLTQDVFKGAPHWAVCAAINSTGAVYLYEDEPYIGRFSWNSMSREHFIGRDYDATNWENSLIMRDTTNKPEQVTAHDKPHGDRSMSATVSAFKCVTGIELTEEQGWLFMQLLKAVRSQQAISAPVAV